MNYNKEIYINGRFLSHPMTGIPRFSYEMCMALHTLGVHFTVVAPGEIQTCYPIPFNLIRYGKLKSHGWEQIELYRFVKSRKNPLLISFSGLGPVFYKNHITTIHDVAFMRHPEWFSRGYNTIYNCMTPLVARSAKKILTVSHFSKQEIVECMDIRPDKIEVVYNALSQKVCGGENKESGPAADEKYILAVSSHDPRKNFTRIIEAFKKLSIPGLKLYIVGSVSKIFNKEDFSGILDENIRVLGHVSDEALAEYYRRASLFVYPSLYEGFGIPPLEAMSNRCPALVSDIPPLREVYADSVLYCNPLDSDSIAGGISIALNDEALRETLIKKGMERQSLYSWIESAKKVIRIIDRN